jgi:hypothetical protein
MAKDQTKELQVKTTAFLKKLKTETISSKEIEELRDV